MSARSGAGAAWRGAGRGAFVQAVLALALCAASTARAQDFERAGPAGPSRALIGFLDSGIPPAARASMAQVLGVSRFALPGLGTRAAAAGAGWRSLRIATGLSQTGDADLGWNAIGVAAGVANPRWGAGLRAVARRDRTVLDPDMRWGAELGGGVWLRLDGPLVAWASAPAVWTSGAAPPLVRGLTMGVAVATDGARAWFEHEARPEAVPPRAAHRAGVALEAGGFGVWAEGLDAPLRAAFGVHARAGAMRIEAGVESHPLLGETVRAALALGTGAGAAP